MGEKMPEFQRPEPRIVGTGTQEEKEKTKNYFLGNFGEAHYDHLSDAHRKILEGAELLKAPHEVEIIGHSNEITNELLAEFGLPEFDIPERNVHILLTNLFNEVGRSDCDAVTFQNKQAIALDAEKTKDPLNRADTILHEMTHLKNFLSIEVTDDDRDTLHRAGLNVYTTVKKNNEGREFNAFRGLNEAVVSEIEKWLFPKLVESVPYLKTEYEKQMSKDVILEKEEIAKRKGIEASEIYAISEGGKKAYGFSYLPQRKVLNYIVDAIYESNEDKFESRDDTMKLFFKAHFDGNIVPIARYIEGVFGKGSFRVLGMMDDRFGNSSAMVMDYLMKHRNRKS